MSERTSLAEPQISSDLHSHNGEPHHHHDHHHYADGADDRHAGDGEARPAGGPLLLDIGGDVGAVIVRLDDDLDGTELRILALDDPDWDPTTHTGVWRRAIGGGSIVVAVYPTLQNGRYRITLPNGRTTDLAVNGSHVTNLDLRSVNVEFDSPT
jgi:hypothetical protein